MVWPGQKALTQMQMTVLLDDTLVLPESKHLNDTCSLVSFNNDILIWTLAKAYRTLHVDVLSTVGVERGLSR